MSEFIHTYCERHDGPDGETIGEVRLLPISVRKSDVSHWEGAFSNPQATIVSLRSGAGPSVLMEYRDFTRAMEEE